MPVMSCKHRRSYEIRCRFFCCNWIGFHDCCGWFYDWIQVLRTIVPQHEIAFNGKMQMKENTTPMPILFKSPKPLGYWVLYAEQNWGTTFSMYHKPAWIQRWFTTKLLGWTWKDAE